MEQLRLGILRWIPIASFLGGLLGMFWELVVLPILSAWRVMNLTAAPDAVQICGGMMAAFPVLLNLVSRIPGVIPSAEVHQASDHPPAESGPKAPPASEIPPHVAPDSPEAI